MIKKGKNMKNKKAKKEIIIDPKSIPSLEEIISGAFPGKRVICLIDDSASFSVFRIGVNSSVEELGMIEAARLLSEIKFGKSFVNQPEVVPATPFDSDSQKTP